MGIQEQLALAKAKLAKLEKALEFARTTKTKLHGLVDKLQTDMGASVSGLDVAIQGRVNGAVDTALGPRVA